MSLIINLILKHILILKFKFINYIQVERTWLSFIVSMRNHMTWTRCITEVLETSTSMKHWDTYRDRIVFWASIKSSLFIKWLVSINHTVDVSFQFPKRWRYNNGDCIYIEQNELYMGPIQVKFFIRKINCIWKTLLRMRQISFCYDRSIAASLITNVSIKFRNAYLTETFE